MDIEELNESEDEEDSWKDFIWEDRKLIEESENEN